MEVPKKANNKSSPVNNQETPKVKKKNICSRKILVTNAEVHKSMIIEQQDFDNIEVVKTTEPKNYKSVVTTNIAPEPDSILNRMSILYY